MNCRFANIPKSGLDSATGQMISKAVGDENWESIKLWKNKNGFQGFQIVYSQRWFRKPGAEQFEPSTNNQKSDLLELDIGVTKLINNLISENIPEEEDEYTQADDGPVKGGVRGYRERSRTPKKVVQKVYKV